MVRLRPPAKINLSLEVVGKRTDGYHELVSVMQTVTLADELTVREAPEVSFRCSEPGLDNPQNLVARAATLVQQRLGAHRGCHIELAKRIPTGAGLGGGSSDAAAALVALDRLWQGGAGCERLRTMAEELGSDVPFFLSGGTALVQGRGETVRRLPPAPETWYLLVRPPIHVSTARVFSCLPPRAWTDGAATRSLAARLTRSKPVEVGINGLQETLFGLCPEAQACFDAVEPLAPGRTLVSGSGPTVFAVFRDRSEAEAADRALAGGGYWTVVVTNYHPLGWEVPCA